MNADPQDFRLSRYDLAMAAFFGEWEEVPAKDRAVLKLAAMAWPANQRVTDKVGAIAFLHALASALALVQPNPEDDRFRTSLAQDLDPEGYKFHEGRVGQYLYAKDRNGQVCWVWLFPE